MIITCPSCSSRYPVDATSFAPSGRKVRCAKCGNTWHQAPPSDLGGDADEDGRKGKTPVPAIASEDANAVRPAPIGQKPLFNSGAAKQKPVEPEVAPAAPVLALAVVTPADALDDDDIIFAPVETSASKPVDAAETPVKLYDVKSAQVQTGGAMRRYLNDVASMRRGRVFGAIGWIALTLFVLVRSMVLSNTVAILPLSGRRPSGFMKPRVRRSISSGLNWRKSPMNARMRTVCLFSPSKVKCSIFRAKRDVSLVCALACEMKSSRNFITGHLLSQKAN